LEKAFEAINERVEFEIEIDAIDKIAFSLLFRYDTKRKEIKEKTFGHQVCFTKTGEIEEKVKYEDLMRFEYP